MKNQILKFLKSFTNQNEDCNVGYKSYADGNFIEQIPFSEVLNILISDYNETKSFFESCGICNVDENKLFKIMCKQWERHIVVFR